MGTLIAANEISVAFDHRVVLDRASLAIHEGDRVGLVGRNGCGKTTFLRLLAGERIPDDGEITRRRELVVGYLPQDFALDPAATVHENVRAGARHVIDLIGEFEALPHDSPRHADLEHRIQALEGWTLDQRLATAMARLNCPRPDARVGPLSGGEKRRVALCRALVARPDCLILDEPTNHLDPDAIEWVAEFLEEFRGAFLVVTHDRYFLDRVVHRMVELANGKFFSHEGNYSEYLLAKAERESSDASVERKRQAFLRRELEWVRAGVRAQRRKSKIRFERYDEVAANEGVRVEADMELVIPPPPPLGNRVVDITNLGVELGGKRLIRNFSFSFENGRRVGVVGRNGLGKTTFLKVILGEIEPIEGTVKPGSLTRFNYVDQGRMQLREEFTALEEVSDGTEFVIWGEARLSLRAYLKRFLFDDDRMTTRVKYLSGGERSRLLLARILKNGGNFLILDEPTNDLDLSTLRVLEEALIAFPGAVLVVSHDRYFLNRVCTDVLAFEGEGRVAHSVGDYDYYLEKRARMEAGSARKIETDRRAGTQSAPTSNLTAKPRRPGKLSFQEGRELEGMEGRILEVEAEIARIEGLFASPDFYRTHTTQAKTMTETLDKQRQTLAQLYLRWEELEQIKAGS
ncbi:MAG: ABC-F family ATP-binding cassette domain-containing protein [Verrucomicrobia bacterium]|nr:ABC-F family ATP-binding cassette domain-containing protein [Verrucomicrobiota bacterium]